MGGMLALEWSFFGKHYVRSLVLIATSARQSPWAIAWAENQRSTIVADSKFRGECYGDDPPIAGLAAARMAAMLLYRMHSSFEKRFGRRRMTTEILAPKSESSCQVLVIEDNERNSPGIFMVQSYLQYQGAKFNGRFDANCYLHILDKINSHDISRGRSSNMSESEATKEVLGQIRQRTLVVAIPTDGLYPFSEQMTLFENMLNAIFASLESDDGHDGFLLESEQLNDLLNGFL